MLSVHVIVVQMLLCCCSIPLSSYPIDYVFFHVESIRVYLIVGWHASLKIGCQNRGVQIFAKKNGMSMVTHETEGGFSYQVISQYNITFLNLQASNKKCCEEKIHLFMMYLNFLDMPLFLRCASRPSVATAITILLLNPNV